MKPLCRAAEMQYYSHNTTLQHLLDFQKVFKRAANGTGGWNVFWGRPHRPPLSDMSLMEETDIPVTDHFYKTQWALFSRKRMSVQWSVFWLFDFTDQGYVPDIDVALKSLARRQEHQEYAVSRAAARRRVRTCLTEVRSHSEALWHLFEIQQ